MSEAPLESYLASILSQGQKVSSGNFTLDVGAARRKMAQFFTPTEVDFLHFWVRFAVTQQASRIAIEVTSKGLEFQYEGAPPLTEMVAGGILAPTLPPRYLHMGIVGAFHQGFDEIVLETKEGEVLFLPDQPERLVSHRRSRSGCRFQARARSGSGHWKNPKALHRALHFPALQIPLWLQGRQLPIETPANRLSRVDGLGREWFLHLPSTSSPDWPQLTPAEVHILVHGADLGGLATHAFPPCSALWVDYPEIPLDLSLRKIHQGVPYQRLSQELASLAAQTVSALDSHTLAQMAPPVLDWLAEIHSRAGRYPQALETALQAVQQGLNPTHLICCGLLERAALLAERLQHSRAEELRGKASEAWAPQQAAARQADPLWIQYELQKPSSAQIQQASQFQTQWMRLVRGGCLCRSEHDGLAPAYEQVRGSFCLALYQEQIRLSVYGEEHGYSWKFLEHLKDYRKDSLVYNGLRLREAARRSMSAGCTADMVFSAQVITAALQGQETFPDQDLSQLSSTQLDSLAQLVESICLRSSQLPPHSHTRELARVSQEIESWRRSASIPE